MKRKRWPDNTLTQIVNASRLRKRAQRVIAMLCVIAMGSMMLALRMDADTISWDDQGAPISETIVENGLVFDEAEEELYADDEQVEVQPDGMLVADEGESLSGDDSGELFAMMAEDSAEELELQLGDAMEAALPEEEAYEEEQELAIFEDMDAVTALPEEESPEADEDAYIADEETDLAEADVEETGPETGGDEFGADIADVAADDANDMEETEPETGGDEFGVDIAASEEDETAGESAGEPEDAEEPADDVTGEHDGDIDDEPAADETADSEASGDEGADASGEQAVEGEAAADEDALPGELEDDEEAADPADEPEEAEAPEAQDIGDEPEAAAEDAADDFPPAAKAEVPANGLIDVQSVEGDGYAVTAGIFRASGLPEGARLYADELTGAAAADYLARAEAELGALRFARFFDIGFRANGAEVEPDGDVQLDIHLSDVVEGERHVLHFTDDGRVEIVAQGAVEQPAVEEGMPESAVEEDNADGQPGLPVEDLTAGDVRDADEAAMDSGTAGVVEVEPEDADDAQEALSTAGAATVSGADEAAELAEADVAPMSMPGLPGDGTNVSVRAGSFSVYAVVCVAGEEENWPAQDFEESTDTMKVTVTAPAGAFPAGTTMSVTDVDDVDTLDAIAGAVEEESVAVKRVHAVDITFRDASGAEIEPLLPISVVMTVIERPETQPDAVVVHVDGEGSASVVEQDEVPAEADVAFTADSFSVYAYVEVIQTWIITADGAAFRVSVTYGPETGIPGGAKLAVEEILDASELYAEYLSKTEDALGMREVGAGYIRLFDISIVDKDNPGVEYQPAAGTTVDVRIELADSSSENLSVVHFADENDRGSLVDADVDGQTVRFEAPGFSIYAVVDETKRLKYVFHYDDKVVATEYVKEGENLYDPGLVVDYGQTFIGWAYAPNEADESKAYSIQELNQQLSATDWEGVEDLQEVHLYATTRDAYYLRYMTVDEQGKEIVLKTVSVRTDAANKVVEIDYDFTGEEGQTFEGWIDVSDGHLYQVGDTLTLDHHIDLYSKAHGRNWLVFDANAGGPGSGATYTPPQLLIGEATTTRPADPTRKGYTFQGWYTNPEGTGSQFQFGSTISSDTVLYAKWTPDNTDYYVIFWRQKASDEAGLPDDQKEYDYVESVQRSALTDSTAALQNADKTKSTGEYVNCNFNASLSDAQKTVNADGTTTLNVYYDRNAYTLTFQVYDYTYTVSNNDNDNTPAKYGDVNGQKARVYWKNGAFRETNYSNGTVYTGTVYTRSDNKTWQTIKTITALYEHSIAGEFPIVGSNGVTYNNGDRWLAQNGSTFSHSDVLVTIDKMPAENVNFHWSDPGSRPTKTMNYYVQALDEETEAYQAAVYADYPQASKDVGATSKETNYSYSGRNYSFTLYDQIKARYNKVTESEDFIEITGFTRWTSNPRYSNGVALDNMYADGTINMYYTRDKYTIHYISQGPNVTDRSEKQDDKVYFEASQAPYGLQADGSWYYEPTNGKDGYFFVGWYEDKACTVPYDFNARMPANDVTVYAKWDTQRVRVVLVPTKDNAHNDEVQMANNQVLAFRLDYKEPVSDENIKSGVIKRTGYRLVGWYTSPTFEEETLWNFNTEVSKEVPAVNMNYQSSDNPDWVNNTYGDNDGAHDNVRGILKLYAKWELTVDENRVYVEYDVPEEYCTHDSQGNLQTTIPVDETAYVLTDDNITATIREAPTGYADGFKFAGWQLLNSDGSEASVNPFTGGSTQTLDRSYIEERTITDDLGNTATIKVIRLKAKFDIDEDNIATMVTFDGNGGVTNDAAQNDRVTETIQVNKTFSTPESGDFVREGHTQVGWAFDSEMTADDFKDLVNDHTSGGTVDYDALAHLGVFEMGETVAADNKLLTEYNNWDPLENTIYAIWEVNTYTVTMVKRVEGDAAAGKMFTFNLSASADDYTLAQEDVSFQLAKDGERALANKVPYGATLTLAETPAVGYSVKAVEIKQTTDPAGLELENPITSEGEDGGTYTIKGDTVITYTNEKAKEQKVRVRKVGSDAPGDGLAGAVFTLTPGGEVVGFEEKTGLTSGDDGIASMDDVSVFDLPLGEYTLTETTAPDNYIGLAEDVPVVVTADGVKVGTEDGGYRLDNVAVSGPDADGVYTLTVMNIRKINITLLKQWYAVPNKAPVQVKLYSKYDGQQDGPTQLDTYVLNEDENWQKVVSGLPAHVMVNGEPKPLRYYIVETGIFDKDADGTLRELNYFGLDNRYMAVTEGGELPSLTVNGYNSMSANPPEQVLLSGPGTLVVGNHVNARQQFAVQKTWYQLQENNSYGWENVTSSMSGLYITGELHRKVTYTTADGEQTADEVVGEVKYSNTEVVTLETSDLFATTSAGWLLTIPETSTGNNDGHPQMPNKGIWKVGDTYYPATYTYYFRETKVEDAQNNDVTHEWFRAYRDQAGNPPPRTELYNYRKTDLTIIKKWTVNDRNLTKSVKALYFTVKDDQGHDWGKIAYESENPALYGLEGKTEKITLDGTDVWVVKLTPTGEGGAWSDEERVVISSLLSSMNETHTGIGDGQTAYNGNDTEDSWPEVLYTVTEVAYQDAEGDVQPISGLCAPVYEQKVRSYNNDWQSNGSSAPTVQLGYAGDTQVRVTNTLAYDVNIKKTSDDINSPLAGAHFALYDTDPDGEGAQPMEGKEDLASGADGRIPLGQLDVGTYYLVETHAPDGYNALNAPVVIEVDPTSVLTKTVDSKELPLFVTYTQYAQDGTTPMTHSSNNSGIAVAEKVQNGEVIGYQYTLTVINTSGAKLPSTGGAGTMGYTIAGLLLIFGAALLLVRRRAEE